MKLYHTPNSPPSRSVLMTLRCLDVHDIEIENVDLLKGENKTPEFLRLNPLGQVPVLVDGNVIVTESRAIMAYLANSRNSQKFYPTDVRQRAIVDSRLYYDATGLYVHILASLGPIYLKGAKEVTPEARDKLVGALDHLETFLEGKSYFAGEEPSLADISILSSVVEVRNAFRGLGGRPNLHAWYERCSGLPGYVENLTAGEINAASLEQLSVKLTPLE